MPKLTQAVPKYRKHRASGQAVVTIAGRDHYLGPYGTKASRIEYDRIITEWLVNGRQPVVTDQADLTITELLSRFWKYAKTYYRKPDGSPSSELHNLKLAYRPLRRLYGPTPAADFAPLALQAVRKAMIEEGTVRTSINKHVGRIKLLFKWGAANQLVPPSVFHGLATISGLRAGRSEARESEPVKPVPEAFVEAVLPYLTPPVRAMVELQLLTAARPGEVIAMRGCDLDTSGRIWLYRPEQHKTAYRGHERTIYLGPQAQRIVKPFLTTNLEAPLFRPKDGKAHYLAQKHAARRTPLSCGNRPGSKSKRNRKRAPGERYTLQSYNRAIKKAIAKVNREHERIEQAPIPDWHVHQLRHNAATRLRKEFGIDAARVILGHRSPAITEVYAELDRCKAMEIISQIG